MAAARCRRATDREHRRTGTDASGSVLPGVTVEATSPALIEKVRWSSPTGTDRVHRRIVDLRPGVYTVTFQPELLHCSA